MTLKSQACEPCAKRKVRCDREEPCSNCKRRKHDHCTYPETSPAERIKELEALVQSLQQQVDGSNGPATEVQEPCSGSRRSRARPAQRASKDNTLRLPQAENASTIVQDDGRTVYLESCAWPKWDRDSFGPGDVMQPDTVAFSLPKALDALQNIIVRDQSIDLSVTQPRSRHATILWDTFYQNVHPSLKISFDWELKKLEALATGVEANQEFTPQEHTFIFALYLLSVQSLSNEECLASLEQPKSALLSGFQSLCEQALARTGFPTVSDVQTVQALTMYLASGIDRLSIGSTWSLMGLLIRSAERLGLHRDGTLLKLSPVETEKRRRIWWQLQHVDLALTVRGGATPLTLMADWDTKLPLNIEDNDINAEMEELPVERKGVTSMSYCLWTYWVLNEQRSFRRADGTRLGFGWFSNRSLSPATKTTFLNRLENGLNNKFIKYCDPLSPLDTLIHLVVRSFVCGMRRLMLHSLAQEESKKYDDELLEVCIRCLEYDVALKSCQASKNYRWRLEGYFAWGGLAAVLYEARRQRGSSKGERLWKLLEGLYTVNNSLSDLSDDPRKICAAELITTAWKLREDALLNITNQNPPKPRFLAGLENQLSTKRTEATNEPGEAGDELKAPTTRPADSLQIDMSLLNDDVLFSDIDWSFWESLF